MIEKLLKNKPHLDQNENYEKKIHTCFRTKEPKNYSIRKYIMFILGGHDRPISYSPLHEFNTIVIAHR